MKALFDFLPLILFFAANKFYDIYIATGVLIVVTYLQVAFFWLQNKRIERMHLIMLVAVTLFGGLTLLLRDPTFLKWKVSIVNWMFALIIFGSVILKKSVIKAMMGKQITLPDPVWARLSIAWGLFFLAMGFLNMYVAFYYQLDMPEDVRLDTWVNFKVFWVLGLTLAFSVLQMLFMAKYLDPDELDSSDKPDPKSDNGGEE
ncbi:MAG: septation protein A [Arenicellales bacterium]